MNILLIGNSKRTSILADNLSFLGYIVTHIYNSSNLPSKLSYDVVVLPIPSVKNGYINLDGTPLTIDDIVSRTEKNTLIIGCNVGTEQSEIIDLNARDDFAYLNAIPTAEGAISIAICESDKSLFYSDILIVGFGRVAKILADRLRPLCKKITIAARSLKDLSCAKALGYDTISIKNLETEAKKYDIIFQTVPAPIITDAVISNLNYNTLIIELSSGYIGTDCLSAENNNIQVIKAGGLPEKTAPITAGNILTESVISIIYEKLPDHTLGE